MRKNQHYNKYEIDYITDRLDALHCWDIDFIDVANKLGRSEESVKRTYSRLGGEPLYDVYCVYDGDKFISVGTIREIARDLGINEQSVRVYGTYSYFGTKEYGTRRLYKLRRC